MLEENEQEQQKLQSCERKRKCRKDFQVEPRQRTLGTQGGEERDGGRKQEVKTGGSGRESEHVGDLEVIRIS